MRSAFSSRRRRRLAAGLALVLVVAVVVGVVLSAGSGAPKPASSARSTSGATTVERRDLVETDTESGTLGYANPQTGYDRLSGTITWLPSVGQVIEFWQTLFEVDSEPVILMNGTRPAYRDLSASDTAGQDILQLNRNLVDLGFDPAGIVVDDEWQAASTAGVEYGHPGARADRVPARRSADLDCRRDGRLDQRQRRQPILLGQRQHTRGRGQPRVRGSDEHRRTTRLNDRDLNIRVSDHHLNHYSNDDDEPEEDQDVQADVGAQANQLQQLANA